MTVVLLEESTFAEIEAALSADRSTLYRGEEHSNRIGPERVFGAGNGTKFPVHKSFAVLITSCVSQLADGFLGDWFWSVQTKTGNRAASGGVHSLVQQADLARVCFKFSKDDMSLNIAGRMVTSLARVVAVPPSQSLLVSDVPQLRGRHYVSTDGGTYINVNGVTQTFTPQKRNMVENKWSNNLPCLRVEYQVAGTETVYFMNIIQFLYSYSYVSHDSSSHCLCGLLNNNVLVSVEAPRVVHSVVQIITKYNIVHWESQLQSEAASYSSYYSCAACRAVAAALQLLPYPGENYDLAALINGLVATVNEFVPELARNDVVGCNTSRKTRRNVL